MTLKEIEENDYNLNIPRYIDTFEAEESIDINKTAEEIKIIDQKIKETDKVIDKYCKELKISTPF